LIEDFSIYLQNIPINPSEYNSNPDLLQAMISVNLEKILVERFMKDEELTEEEAKDLS
jgi:hypothetical protein